MVGGGVVTTMVKVEVLKCHKTEALRKNLGMYCIKRKRFSKLCWRPPRLVQGFQGCRFKVEGSGFKVQSLESWAFEALGM